MNQVNFKHLESDPQLEKSDEHVTLTPNIWDKKFTTEHKIILHHCENSNQLHVRLIFCAFSRDKSKYLSRFFDSLYQLNFELNLNDDNLQSEILKIIPVVQDLITKFEPEYKRLIIDYDLPNLASFTAKTLAGELVKNFNPSSDISHL